MKIVSLLRIGSKELTLRRIFRAVLYLFGSSLLFSWLAIGTALAKNSGIVAIGGKGEVLVEGKPFFPIFVWAQPRKLIAAHSELGINALVPGENEKKEGSRLELLNDLNQHGMFALLHVKEYSPDLANHPALLSWMHGDEPDIAGPLRLEFDVTQLPAGEYVLVEGESAQWHNFNSKNWMNKESVNLSGGRWLSCEASTIPETPFAARYEFEAPKTATYNFFVREFNKTWACPTTWRLDGGEWKTTARSLRTVENKPVAPNADVGWADYGTVHLAAGKHVLEIEVREARTTGGPGKTSPSIIGAYDLFLFTTAKKWPPAKSYEIGPRHQPEALKAEYNDIRAKDPKHPVWMNLTAGFHSSYRKIDPRWYPLFSDSANILSYDHYPVTGWNRPDRVPELASLTKEFVALYPKKSPWVIVEASDQDLKWTPKETRGPTPKEMRAEVWMAVTSGAKGIGYFTIAFEPFRWMNLSPEIKDEMKRTNTQLKELAPVILAHEDGPPVKCSSNDVQFLVRQYQNAVYLFAVNLETSSDVEVKFAFPEGLRGRAAEVIGENRILQFDSNSLKDSFEALDVHLYRIDL